MKINVHFFSTYYGFGFGLTPEQAVEACRASNGKTVSEMKKLIKGHSEGSPAYNMIRLPAGAVEVKPGAFGGCGWNMAEGQAPGEAVNLTFVDGKWRDPEAAEIAKMHAADLAALTDGRMKSAF